MGCMRETEIVGMSIRDTVRNKICTPTYPSNPDLRRAAYHSRQRTKLHAKRPLPDRHPARVNRYCGAHNCVTVANSSKASESKVGNTLYTPQQNGQASSTCASGQVGSLYCTYDPGRSRLNKRCSKETNSRFWSNILEIMSTLPSARASRARSSISGRSSLLDRLTNKLLHRMRQKRVHICTKGRFSLQTWRVLYDRKTCRADNRKPCHEHTTKHLSTRQTQAAS